MKLISIWGAGALVPAITFLALALIGWLLYQAHKAHNSGGTRQERTGNGAYLYDDDKTPYKKIPQFWMAVAVLVLYAVAISQIYSDYRPYNAKKDGVPRVQTDTSRVAAEDLLPK